MVIKKAVNRIRNMIWTKKHKKLNEENRSKLSAKGRRASIISMNCTGGILSHDLGLQFKSPTVNLFFRAEDFIKFCENLKYYLAINEFIECTDPGIIENRKYPIVYLGDLLIFLVQYKSVEEAQNKWNERKKRFNWDIIVIIDTDREGMTEDLKDRFEALPYRKIMFTHLPDKRHSSCFYIKGYEKDNCVGIITDHDTWDGKRPVDQFDWVRFINGDS